MKTNILNEVDSVIKPENIYDSQTEALLHPNHFQNPFCDFHLSLPQNKC